MTKNQGRRNRQRGQEGEREVCSLLTEWLQLPEALTRNLGQERDGGHDVSLKIAKMKIEVKRRKRVANLYEWLDDADVVALRGDGSPWLMVMPMHKWALLMRAWLKENGTANAP